MHQVGWYGRICFGNGINYKWNQPIGPGKSTFRLFFRFQVHPQHPAIFWHFCRNFRSVHGPLHKLPCRSRYRKQTWHVFCTNSKKGLENRSSRFEPIIRSRWFQVHRCRRSVDYFLIDWSICHGRYRGSIWFHLRENMVDIIGRFDFTYGRIWSTYRVHSTSRKKSVDIEYWFRLIHK